MGTIVGAVDNVDNAAIIDIVDTVEAIWNNTVAIYLKNING